MLEASFDAQRSRVASISGAYQYDTGQRIRMYGLPGPHVMRALDELLSGTEVTVQAQFAAAGAQTSEPRLAQYDPASGTWICDVPDSCLTAAEPVQVYVYVMYGADGERSRAKTMYTGAFTPISRPAPNGAVTPDQLNAWDALVTEVNLKLSEMSEAVSGANAAAEAANAAEEAANTAAAAANTAAAAANAAGNAWGSATASAKTLDPGSDATVTLTDKEDGTRHIEFGIPQGEKGEKGDMGPAGVTFRLDGATLYITTDK